MNPKNTELNCYVHSVSPVKRSDTNCQYFDMKLQTKDETVRAVCFSPEKHKTLKAKGESCQPCKIYMVKRSRISDGEDVIMNKRTRIGDGKCNFDHAAISDVTKVQVNELNDVQANKIVDIEGKITYLGVPQEVMYQGKPLVKQSAILSDSTGSIMIAIWDKLVETIRDGG